jgi:DNA-binding GntR family transcriptional regulator
MPARTKLRQYFVRTFLLNELSQVSRYPSGMSAQQVQVTIDRASPVPLYHQLAEQLSRSIVEGQLKPGDPFENEVAVAERLQLSRPTVRRAIQELVDQGMLVRRRGLGTTVANRKVHRKLELTSLYDDLQRDGRKPRTTVLSHERETEERAASALDLAPDSQLLHVVRVRYAGDLPLALMHNWIPEPHNDISREELESGGLYAALRARGVKPVVATQSIGARMPKGPERKHLQITGTQPLLTMTRTAFDASGNPVEYGDHCYRASDYTIDLMVDER